MLFNQIIGHYLVVLRFPLSRQFCQGFLREQERIHPEIANKMIRYTAMAANVKAIRPPT
jgi:hypothetical protein